MQKKKKILSELYNGNIVPQSRPIPKDSKYREIQMKLSDLEDAINQKLKSLLPSHRRLAAYRNHPTAKEVQQKMKNRRFPYGYEMADGYIIPNHFETEILKNIFSDYIGGMNLQEVADKLTRLKAEYLPGETTWNKSRIKRIIEDKRYLGTQLYPGLISESVFAAANKTKDERRTATDYVINENNKILTGTVHCAECGGRLYHRTDNTQKHNETWYCKTDGCKKSVQMTIAELLFY